MFKKAMLEIKKCDANVDEIFTATHVSNYLAEKKHSLLNIETRFYRSKIIASVKELMTIESFF